METSLRYREGERPTGTPESWGGVHRRPGPGLGGGHGISRSAEPQALPVSTSEKGKCGLGGFTVAALHMAPSQIIST